MANSLSTSQVSRLTGVPKPTIIDHSTRYLKPHSSGNNNESHRWTKVQCLALGCGQVLRAMGMRGTPINNSIRLIASYSEQELELVLESRPVLCVLPGVAVVSQLVPREFVQQEATRFFDDFGVSPIGVDVARMWQKLNQQIADYDESGWQKQGVA